MKEKKWFTIRIVNDGQEDYSHLAKLYNEEKYEEIADYLKQWDYGEYYDEIEKPKLALYDELLFKDKRYELLYNASIGGTVHSVYFIK